MTDEAEKKIHEVISSIYACRDKSFVNARFARNLFEKTLQKQTDRIGNFLSLDKEILSTITIEDIPSN